MSEKEPPPDDQDPIKAQMAKAEPVKPGSFDLYAIDGGRGGAGKPNTDSDGPPDDGAPPHEGFESADVDAGFGPNMPPEDIEMAQECANLDQNDRDNGRRLMVWFGDDLAYVAGMGWMTWRGTHWQRDEGELQSRLLAQNLVDKIKLEVYAITPTKGQKAMIAAADAAAETDEAERTPAQRMLIASGLAARKQVTTSRTARRKFAVSSGNATKTTAMLTQATSIAAVDQEVLDADRMAFNVTNGTLKFRRVVDDECPDPDTVRMKAEISFENHAREDHITRRAAVDYAPDATCPQWDTYLERAHPDPMMRTFLQVFHAQAILVGGNDEQKILYHYGSGGEGKTTLIEVLGDLSDGYRATMSPDSITGDGGRQGQQASPDIARLFNARFVTVDELPRGQPLRENLLKAMSGGTKQLARFLQKEFFEFTPLFTAVLAGNDMPETSGLDDGLWRRLLIVHWKVKIEEADRRNMGQTRLLLDAERSGILNWLLEGLKLYLANGLESYVPDSVRKFTSEYRSDRDQPGQFFEACIIKSPGAEPPHRVQAKDMYEAYTTWCEANGYKPWNNTNFGKRLAALGVEKTKGRLVYYQNVQLGDIPSKFDPKEPPPDR